MGRKSIAEIRREEIIEAFVKVVTEKGFGKATTREVAKAAGCSQGMLNHYFTSKETMVLSVMEHVSQSYMEDFEKGIESHSSAVDRMRYCIAWFMDFSKFDIDWYRTMMELRTFAKDNPTVSLALRKAYGSEKEIIVKILKQGMKTKEFRRINADVAANMILGSLGGMVERWLLNTEATPLKQMGKLMTDMILDYLKIDFNAAKEN